MNSALRIIVTGLIAQHRLLGGVTWDYLNFLLGLNRLGHDVYYFEDSGEWPYILDNLVPPGPDRIAHDPAHHVEYLAQVMSRFGLPNKWAYHFPIKPDWFGLSEIKRKEIIKSADLLINVSGTLENPENYRQIPRLAYIDTDPVFTQIRLAQGETNLKDRVAAHDVHFSVGECLDQTMPTGGYLWRATKHPIVLSEWRTSSPQRDVFTTVMNWTSYPPLTFRGQNYGQKDAEFMRFLELPNKATPVSIEVALSRTYEVTWQSDYQGLPPSIVEHLSNGMDWTPSDLLTHAGWRVVDAAEVCGDFRGYRQYIQCSKAEWSVAKNGYVKGQTGWFSGRSACYLAAGRPVVVQDTGFGPVLPVGEGILSFSTIEEAAAAIKEVEGNYARHQEAALSIAREYFDSDKVLTRLIDGAMSNDV